MCCMIFGNLNTVRHSCELGWTTYLRSTHAICMGLGWMWSHLLPFYFFLVLLDYPAFAGKNTFYLESCLSPHLNSRDGYTCASVVIVSFFC